MQTPRGVKATPQEPDQPSVADWFSASQGQQEKQLEATHFESQSFDLEGFCCRKDSITKSLGRAGPLFSSDCDQPPQWQNGDFPEDRGGWYHVPASTSNILKAQQNPAILLACRTPHFLPSLNDTIMIQPTSSGINYSIQKCAAVHLC